MEQKKRGVGRGRGDRGGRRGGERRKRRGEGSERGSEHEALGSWAAKSSQSLLNVRFDLNAKFKSVWNFLVLIIYTFEKMYIRFFLFARHLEVSVLSNMRSLGGNAVQENRCGATEGQCELGSHSLLIEWPQANHLFSPSLIFSIQKPGMRIPMPRRISGWYTQESPGHPIKVAINVIRIILLLNLHSPEQLGNLGYFLTRRN